MRQIVLFSYALWASSFLSFPLAAECVSTPDCTDLGYDKTSCPSGDSMLKCPFDTAKLKCIPKTCEGIGKRTCGDDCVPTGFTGCCSNSDCASGACDITTHTCASICAVGDIYYSDKTCSANLISGKTPIGVVGHITNGGKNGVVVALENAPSTMEWGCSGTDLSLTNYTDQASAKTDFAGKSNTDVIAGQCGSNTAAYYCKNTYKKGSVSGWYLPAYGELYAIMYTNFSKVNTGLGKVSSSNQIPSSRWYWSSSEISNLDARTHSSGSPNGYPVGKGTTYVRCVLAF